MDISEEEFDLLFNVTEKFWEEYGHLVNNTLLKVPPHLREQLKMMLQEKSDVYSRSGS